MIGDTVPTRHARPPYAPKRGPSESSTARENPDGKELDARLAKRLLERFEVMPSPLSCDVKRIRGGGFDHGAVPAARERRTSCAPYSASMRRPPSGQKLKPV